MINARYSFLQSLGAIGVDIAGTKGGIPKYQDVSMKLNFPLKNSNLAILLLQGTSRISFKDDMTDENEWTSGDLGEDISMRCNQLFSGINYTYRFDNNTRLENRLSAQIISSVIDCYSIGYMNSSKDIYNNNDLVENRFSYSSKLIKKINSKNNLNAGISADVYAINYRMNRYPNGFPQSLYGRNNISPLFRAFFQWQHKFNDQISVIPGAYSHFWGMNQDFSVELRLGFQWKISPTLALGASTGLFSQLQSFLLYLYEREGEMINKNIGMSRSWQSVISIDKELSSSWRVKAEAY